MQRDVLQNLIYTLRLSTRLSPDLSTNGLILFIQNLISVEVVVFPIWSLYDGLFNSGTNLENSSQELKNAAQSSHNHEKTCCGP